MPTSIEGLQIDIIAQSNKADIAIDRLVSKLDKLSNSLNLELPKGASNLVDEIGIKIVKEHGIDKLKEIAKLNFKNTDKIKENL